MNLKKPKIVILGAGFGGLMTVVTLQKELKTEEAEIILVNKHDYHFQRTWLHQAAGGTLHPNRVRFGIKSLLDLKKIQFIQDTVVQIKQENKEVLLKTGTTITYDYLVIALGGELETYGTEGIKEYALSISSVVAARRIQNHIESQFQSYHSLDEPKEGKLTIVVAGAGFTGIEFLGELMDWIPKLCRKYHVDSSKLNIICCQSSHQALPTFDKDLANYAVKVLEKKGVQFKFGKRVKECTIDGVIIGSKSGEDLEEIKANTVIWAAGVRGNSLIEEAGMESINGRVKVQPDLRAPGSEDIFIIGDCSIVENENGEAYSPTAQIALQQGITTGENLISLIRDKKELQSFVPHIRGIVCSLGQDDAVGVVYGKKLVGSKALFMKKVIDNRALYMIGGSSLILKKGRFNLI